MTSEVTKPSQEEVNLGGGFGALAKRYAVNFFGKTFYAQREAEEYLVKLFRGCATEAAEMQADRIKELEEALSTVEVFRMGADWRGSAITVERRAEDQWAICQGGACLNTYGEWEFEPMPGSRNEEFIARARFPLDEAKRRAREVLNKGKSAEPDEYLAKFAATLETLEAKE